MTGYIAIPGPGEHAHCFGGVQWRVRDATLEEVPHLLVTLDLEDPCLRFISFAESRLPLVSHINSRAWEREQTYRVEGGEILVSASMADVEPMPPEARWPNPLPARPLRLRPMRSDEDPDIIGLQEASESFLGGESFIRVGGAPVWIVDKIPTPTCVCSAPMPYVASIGYEAVSHRLYDEPFFYGEGALYFFVCGACSTVKVIGSG